MQFIDSHAHINYEAFDADRTEVIRHVFAEGQGLFCIRKKGKSGAICIHGMATFTAARSVLCFLPTNISSKFISIQFADSLLQNTKRARYGLSQSNVYVNKDLKIRPLTLIKVIKPLR